MFRHSLQKKKTQYACGGREAEKTTSEHGKKEPPHLCRLVSERLGHHWHCCFYRIRRKRRRLKS